MKFIKTIADEHFVFDTETAIMIHEYVNRVCDNMGTSYLIKNRIYVSPQDRLFRVHFPKVWFKWRENRAQIQLFEDKAHFKRWLRYDTEELYFQTYPQELKEG